MFLKCSLVTMLNKTSCSGLGLGEVVIDTAQVERHECRSR